MLGWPPRRRWRVPWARTTWAFSTRCNGSRARFRCIISLGFITSITKFTAQFRAEGRDADIVAAVRFIFYVEMAIALSTTAGLLFFSTRIADHYFSPDQTWIFMLAFLAITPGIQTAIFSATLEGAQVFRYQTVHSLTVTPLALLTKV